jgi:SAM-dependent methyltransferase
MGSGKEGGRLMVSEAGVNHTRLAKYLSPKGSRHHQAKYRKPRRRLGHWLECRTIDRLLRRVGRSRRILDAPCGAGRFFDVLRHHADEVHLADVSPEMLRVAHEETTGRAARYLRLNLLEAGSNGLRAEGVVSIRLMHHLYDPAARDRYLDALAHVADRWVLLTFRDARCPRTRFRKAWKRVRGKPDSICAQTLASICEHMARHGLTLLATRQLSALSSGHRYALFVRDGLTARQAGG